MTNYIWEGSVSALASNAANWIPNGTPAQGDIIIFDGNGTQGCTWDIVLPPSNRSVDEVIIESDFGHALTLNTIIRTKALFLNKTLTAGTASKIVFVNGASPNFFGSYKSFGDRFVMIGDSAAYSGTIDFDMEATAGQKVKFDDGQHSSGTVTLKTAAFAPDYETPTGTLGYTYFPTLTIASGVTWEPAGDIDDTDRLKEFRIDTFNVSIATFDGGMASYEFLATSGGFQIPVNDGSAYNSGDFTAKFRKMKFRATTAGHKIIMPDNRYLSLEELEIGDGVMLLGPTAIDDQGSDIRITKPPKIRGSWSFSQISPGLYRSPQHARGPMSEVKGEFTVTGKLNVTGLIDPTGVEFTAVGSNPGGDTAKTIWVNSADSNKLYFGNSEVGGGGGGGAVDSVFGRTGTVVATEGDYDLDELGDVAITSAAETQILRHNGTQFVNEYNDLFFLRVKAREAINKGEAIYIFDAHNSDVVGVKKARADAASTMPCIGIAYETLALGDEGLAVSFGKANGIAANFTEGETMYVSPTTAGALTNTKPTGNTELIQNVGILMQAHVSNAVVKVTGIGRSNDVPNQFSVGGSITAGSFIKSGGASTEFLKADGSVDTSTYLTTETDPVFTAHPAAGVTNAGGGNIAQGETAFSWGDHGAAGYLTAEADTLDDVVGRGGTSSAAITAPQFIVTGGTSAQFLKGDGSSDATVYIPTGQYEAGSTPISAKGFINTGSDTSWISQTEGSRVVPTDNSSGSTQIFSNGVESLVTAWNQDLVTTQGITYSSGVWTIDTAGIYHIRGQFGLRDGDATGSNGLGNPSSSDFIQALAYILHSSDSADPEVGPSPTPEDFLVRGPTFLYTNGTGVSAKGPVVETIRRLDVGDRIAFALWARKQSNQSSSLKYRMRSGFYNECYIRRIG